MMDDFLRLSVVVRTPEAKSAIERAFGSADDIELRFHEAPLAQLGAKIANGSSPDVLLVDIDASDEAEVQALGAYVGDQQQETAVIATSADGALDTARRLMRMGIVDYVPQPLADDDLRTAVDLARSRIRTIRGAQQSSGKIISVMKTQGGAGATTLAVQTAVAAAARATAQHKRNASANAANQVCLVDLDLQSGSSALYLDARPLYSALDLVAQPERLDASLVRSAVAHHDAGVDLLAAPTELVPMDAIKGEDIRRLFSVLRDNYDHTIVDLPQAWMTWTTTAVKESDLIVLVTQLSVAAVQQTRRRLNALQRLGAGDVPLCLVANRYAKRGLFGGGFSLKEAEAALGRKVDYFIASDFDTVNEAQNLGVPLAEISKGKRVEKEYRRFFEFAVKKLADKAEVGAGAFAPVDGVAAHAMGGV